MPRFLRCLTDSILGVRSSGLRAVRLTILRSQRLSLSQQAFERENGARTAATGRNALCPHEWARYVEPVPFSLPRAANECCRDPIAYACPGVLTHLPKADDCFSLVIINGWCCWPSFCSSSASSWTTPPKCACSSFATVASSLVCNRSQRCSCLAWKNIALSFYDRCSLVVLKSAVCCVFTDADALAGLNVYINDSYSQLYRQIRAKQDHAKEPQGAARFGGRVSSGGKEGNYRRTLWRRCLELWCWDDGKVPCQGITSGLDRHGGSDLQVSGTEVDPPTRAHPPRSTLPPT
jgi:hypothetical protein